MSKGMKKGRRLLGILLAVLLVLGYVPAAKQDVFAATIIQVTLAAGEGGTGEAATIQAPKNFEWTLPDPADFGLLPDTGNHYYFVGWQVPGYTHAMPAGAGVTLTDAAAPENTCTLTAIYEQGWTVHFSAVDSRGKTAGGEVSLGDEYYAASLTDHYVLTSEGSPYFYARPADGYHVREFRDLTNNRTYTSFEDSSYEDVYGNKVTVKSIRIPLEGDLDIVAVFEKDITQYISSAAFSLEKPPVGTYEGAVEGKAEKLDNEPYTIISTNWFAENGIAPQEIVPGQKYFAEIYLLRDEGCDFAADATVTVNGAAAEIYRSNVDEYHVVTALIEAVEPEKYGLWIDGQQFAENKLDITVSNGHAIFDPEKNELTLDGINYEWTEQKSDIPGDGIIMSQIEDLTVIISGDNYFSDSSGRYDFFNAGPGCSVTLTGDGSLKVENCYYGIYAGFYDTPGGDITIDGVSLRIKDTYAAGLWANRNISILNNAFVFIDRKNMPQYNSVVSNIDGTILVDGESILAAECQTAPVHFGNGDTSSHRFILHSGTVSLVNSNADPVEGYGYGIKFEPVSQSVDPDRAGEINGTIQIDRGCMLATSPSGGTNLAENQIIISDRVYYEKGESLLEAGTVIIDNWIFSDVKVKPGNWVFEGVKYVHRKGIMSGDPDRDGDGYTTFNPKNNLKRSEFVSTLYRLADPKGASGTLPFTDVKETAYYYDALRWAYSNNVVSGTSDTTFSPKNEITRQEMASMMMRLAVYMGIDTSASADITVYPDYSKVSGWAREALAWANAEGLISGKKGTGGEVILAPKDKTTRQECASVLMRFYKQFIEEQ